MKGALSGSVGDFKLRMSLFTVLMRSLYKLTDMFNEQLLSEEEQVKHCLQVEGWRVRQSKTVSIVFKVSFYMQFIE